MANICYFKLNCVVHYDVNYNFKRAHITSFTVPHQKKIWNLFCTIIPSKDFPPCISYPYKYPPTAFQMAISTPRLHGTAAAVASNHGPSGGVVSRSTAGSLIREKTTSSLCDGAMLQLKQSPSCELIFRFTCLEVSCKYY